MPTDAGPSPGTAAPVPGASGIPAEVRGAPFPYLRWAKRYLDPSDPRSLGLSGVRWPRALDLPGPPPDALLEVAAGLRAALAERYGMRPENVQLTSGSSAANFLVYQTLARGGRVLAETPAYEALHVLAPAVSAQLACFQRDPARGWRIDPGSLAEALQGGVDLLVVTDLHNPSGKALHPDDLALLLDAAETHDAYLLVDEVYLDYDPAGRPSVATQSARVVATNSLTKCHGFGMLRAGWILADADVIRRIDEQADIVDPGLPPHAQRVALAYLPHADAALRTTRERAHAALQQVDRWVEETPGASWVRPEAGITGFIDLDVDGTAFCEHLMQAHGVRAVPGAFFQRPRGVRVSFLLEPELLGEDLVAMSKTLEAMQTAP